MVRRLAPSVVRAALTVTALRVCAGACRNVLTGEATLPFTSLAWFADSGFSGCSAAPTCTALLSENVLVTPSSIRLSLSQKPCFREDGSNDPRCCAEDQPCAAWAGASVKSADCVDRGVVVTRLKFGGTSALVRGDGWEASVFGGAVVKNSTVARGPVHIVQGLTTRSGSAPAFHISMRPPGIGKSPNSATNDFVMGAGGVWAVRFAFASQDQ
jgi:hypothetical protein